MDFKEAAILVKSNYDLADYLRSTGVTVKPSGVGRWKACCPYHKEKTPSFSISDSFQHFICFGCGVKGDIISYVMDQENLSFTETIKKLAADKNIELDLDDNISTTDYESLRKIVRDAALFYWKSFNELENGHPAKTEIVGRDLELYPEKGTAPQYGFAPNGHKLIEFLKKRGYSEDLAVEAGLCREKDGKYYDFFRGRLMFFFSDRQGRPIGFSSRKIYEEDYFGKYVNSPETPLFLKSKVLYNHDIARKTTGKEKKIYVTEGQFDVAAFCQSGLPNTVATSGTAFTKDHAQECKRMVGDDGKIIFCFDGDSAGIKAAKKVFTGIPEIHEDAYVVVFPDKLDPCDYRQKYGEEKLLEYVSKYESLVEFMIKQEAEGYLMTSVVDQSKYVEQAARIVKTITNLTLRENSIKLLSLESRTPIDTVREAVEQAKPFTFQEVSREDSEGKEDVEEKEDTIPLNKEEEKTLESLKEKMKRDIKYSIAAKFFALGLSRKAWRAGLKRSRELFPEDFLPILDELDKFKDRESIFPELFENEEVASFLMNTEFSHFYRFMNEYELKDHLIYLRNRLENLFEKEARVQKDNQILEMLSQDESMSLEYFEKVLQEFSE